MKLKLSILSIVVAACLSAATPLTAAGVQVVANNSVKASAVSADELKSVFLGTKKSLGDGSNVEPVLAETGGAHDAFLKEVLGKSDQALRNYYKTLVFTGKGAMPKSFASDADILKYVAKTPGAIGYVSAGADTAGVKKLAIN